MESYKVGEIAKIVGVNVETLRYYEKIHLMPKPKRLKSGYRYYNQMDIKRLIFIKRAKELGFTLKEIRELLNLKISSSSTCGDVRHLAERKLKDIEEKIKDLRKIRSVLLKLIKQCVREQYSLEECPILEVIEKSGNKV